MKKFLRACFFFTLLFVLCNHLLGWGLDRFYAQPEMRKSKHAWVMAKEGLELDFALLGSSRMLNNVSVHELENALGMDGIDLSDLGNGYADNYLLLQMFLKKNKVRNLILNVDEFSFTSAQTFSYPFHDYEYVPWSGEEIVEQTFQDNVDAGRRWAWKILPAARYYEFNKEYSLLESWRNRGVSNAKYDSTDGSRLQWQVAQERFGKLYHHVYIAAEEDQRYFEKIISDCERRGIRLLLLSSPKWHGMDKYLLNSGSIYAYIEEVARARSLPWLRHEAHSDFQNAEDFYDYKHLNGAGAIRYSRYLAKELKGLLDFF